MLRWTGLMALAGACLAQTVCADITAGEKTVVLMDQSGQRHEIATLIVSDDGAYTLNWNDAPFSDFFLSMRPFKCLTGKDKHWCHVPYPYANSHRISQGDLTDLEYDLLFLWKRATDYGVNMWNGVYYRLEQQGDRLRGQMYEIDMDLLSAPPAEGDLRPLQVGDLHETDPDSHWLPEIVIE